MASSRTPKQQRLIDAAVELFAAQGVTETTTKQIAERAGVNEVTLFRQFGSKYGLLLAVIEDAAIMSQMGQTLIEQASETSSIYSALRTYAMAYLQSLERVPDVVRSIVGEAGHYPTENRKALGQGLTLANRSVAEYFQTVIDRDQLPTHLSAETLASLLNSMLLGYAVIELTSEFHELWHDREEFLENLMTLFLHGAVTPLPDITTEALTGAPTSDTIADLPALLVHQILQQGKKAGPQAYALTYVLFGAGLSPSEVVGLERSHYVQDAHYQLLQIGHDRQVPLNQWILGKRYGSYTKNPLTQWIKSRKDANPALFLGSTGEAISEAELRQHWRDWTSDRLTPDAHAPAIEQAQSTWCVEMLMKGISITDLQRLTGLTTPQLLSYAHRAREKAALEQAIRLDQRRQPQ